VLRRGSDRCGRGGCRRRRRARRNLEPLGARVVAGDLFDALPRDLLSRVDVLAVNAPYVPTAEIAMMPPEARDHEARAALDGGDDGLDVHRRVAASAREWLAPGGHLLIETSRQQAPTTAALVTAGGLEARIRSRVGQPPSRVPASGASPSWASSSTAPARADSRIACTSASAVCRKSR